MTIRLDTIHFSRGGVPVVRRLLVFHGEESTRKLQ